jgi:hypothetical protein
MSKSKKSVIAVYAIVFVVFNVLYFAIPFNKTASTWVCYGASLLSIILGYGITEYAFKNTDTLQSKVYGFPVFRIGYIYFAVQTVFSIIMFGINAYKEVPAWVAVVFSVLILAGALIGVIATDNTRDVIEKQEQQDRAKTKAITYFKLDVDNLVDMCSDGELKKRIEKLADTLKYSDPVSADELRALENQISNEIASLGTLINTNPDYAKEKVTHIENLLADRNRRCKALKK